MKILSFIFLTISMLHATDSRMQFLLPLPEPTLIDGSTITIRVIQMPNVDAPSAVDRHEPQGAITSPCGWSGCWDYNHPTLTIGQTLKSKTWIITQSIQDTAYLADVFFSLQAFKKGCVEGNPDYHGNPHPDMGDYALNYAKFEIPLDIIQGMIISLDRKPATIIVYGMSISRFVIHMHGIQQSMACINPR